MRPIKQNPNNGNEEKPIYNCKLKNNKCQPFINIFLQFFPITQKEEHNK